MEKLPTHTKRFIAVAIHKNLAEAGVTFRQVPNRVKTLIITNDEQIELAKKTLESLGCKLKMGRSKNNIKIINIDELKELVEQGRNQSNVKVNEKTGVIKEGTLIQAIAQKILLGFSQNNIICASVSLKTGNGQILPDIKLIDKNKLEKILLSVLE